MTAEPATQVVVLVTAGRRCAVPVAAVREVVESADVAGLPLLPPGVPGVLRLRGAALPALDLAALLLEAVQHPAARAVVASDGQAEPVALLVDEVAGIVAARTGTRGVRASGFPRAVVSSMGRTPDGDVPLLDLPALLEYARSGR